MRARPRFAAIDFETANAKPTSVCAVGVVVVENEAIVDRFSSLVRPDTHRFSFTSVHGLDAATVAGAPTFDEVWPEVRRRLSPCKFLVAHNAKFDARVLSACLRRHDIENPRFRFRCTLLLTREVLKIIPSDLASACRSLSIPLDHHNALSDAEAAAQIAIRAFQLETHAGAPR